MQSTLKTTEQSLTPSLSTAHASTSTPPAIPASKQVKKATTVLKKAQNGSTSTTVTSNAIKRDTEEVQPLSKLELEKLRIKKEKQKMKRKLRQERNKASSAAVATQSANAENQQKLAAASPIASSSSAVPVSSALLAASTSSNSSSSTTLASSRPVSRAMTSNTAPTEIQARDDDEDNEKEETLDWAADDDGENDSRPKVSIANIVASSNSKKDDSAKKKEEEEERKSALKKAKNQLKNKKKRERKQELSLEAQKKAEVADKAKTVETAENKPSLAAFKPESSKLKATPATATQANTAGAPGKGKKEKQNPLPATRTAGPISSSSVLPPFFAFTAPPVISELYDEPGSRSISTSTSSIESLTLRISLKPLPELRTLSFSNSSKRRKIRDSNGVKEINMKLDLNKFRIKDEDVKISRWIVDDSKSILLKDRLETPVVSIPVTRYEKGKGRMVPSTSGKEGDRRSSSIPLEASHSGMQTLEVKKGGLPRVSSAPLAESSPFISALERVSSPSSPIQSSTILQPMVLGAASTTSTAPSTSIPTPPASTSSASQIRPIVIGETTFYTSSPRNALSSIQTHEITREGLLLDDPAVISTGRKEDFVPAEEVRQKRQEMGLSMQHGRTASTAVIEHLEQVRPVMTQEVVVRPSKQDYPSFYQQQPVYHGYPQQNQQEPFYGPDGNLYVLNAYEQAIPYYPYTNSERNEQPYNPYQQMQIQAPTPLAPPHLQQYHSNPATLANKFIRSNIQPYDSPPISPHQPSLPSHQHHHREFFSSSHAAAYPLSTSSSSNSLHLQHVQPSSYMQDIATPGAQQMINDNGTVYFVPAYTPTHQTMMQNGYYEQQGYQGPVRSLTEYENVGREGKAEWNGGMYGNQYMGQQQQEGMYQY